MWGWWWNILSKPKRKMKDAISGLRIEKLHPFVREDFRNFIIDAEQALGITLRVVQGLRTLAEQDELYSHGRTKLFDQYGTKLGIVTNARAGQSYHNYGLAIDVAELKDGKINWDFNYHFLIPYSEKYNLVWGGNFHTIMDKPHFEKTFWLDWKELLQKHTHKNFIIGTQYVVI